MYDMDVYGLKNCDTCRKALRALGGAKLVDVRAEGVPDALLEAAYEAFGEKLMNTRSTTWRGLDEAERAKAPLELIKEHPALMKRPLISHEGKLFLGWSKDVQAELGV